MGEAGSVMCFVEDCGIPILNRSRVDAESKIGFRRVGDDGLDEEGLEFVGEWLSSSSKIWLCAPHSENTVFRAHSTRSLNFVRSSKDPLPPLNMSLNNSEALLAYWWI
jgi:hypothetical protein